MNNIAKKSFCFAILTFACLFFLYSSPVSAECASIHPDKEHIVITFDHPGDVHKVYLDEEMVWPGKSSSYTFKQLSEATPYTIFIENLTKKTKTIFYTGTLSSEAEKEDLTEDEKFPLSRLNVQVLGNRIILDIGFIPNDGILEVYRNGEKIGETKNHQFIDTQIKDGEVYGYDIHARKKLDEKDILEIINEMKKAGIPISEEILEQISYRSYILGCSDVCTLKSYCQDLLNK